MSERNWGPQDDSSCFKTDSSCLGSFKWWNNQRYQDNGNLNDMNRFATAHGKAQMIPEGTDSYGDGYTMKHYFGNWLKTHRFVALMYWNCSNCNTAYDASLKGNPVDAAAFKEAYVGTHYTGSFWKYKTPPSN
jgi:hypothetical protein